MVAVPPSGGPAEGGVTDGLVLLAAWAQFAVLIGLLLFFVVHGRRR